MSIILPTSFSCKRHNPQNIIAIDGSSTVFPITEAIAEEFQKKYSAKVIIGISGTGGGFKKFCNNEISISGASRSITKSEIEMCAKNNIEYIELPIAYDGITLVVNPKNNWLNTITLSELKLLWEPDAQNKILRWNQIRKNFPNEKIHLFGPGIDSGTYDYFTKAIIGKEHSSRGDFTSSENDNILVQGIATNTFALGFFGYAYYIENKNRLKILSIDSEKGNGPILPSQKTISDGTYTPLSRPIFIYVNKKSSENQKIQLFIDFYISNITKIIQEVGYIPLSKNAYKLLKIRFQKRITKTLFTKTNPHIGITVENLLKDQESKQ